MYPSYMVTFNDCNVKDMKYNFHSKIRPFNDCNVKGMKYNFHSKNKTIRVSTVGPYFLGIAPQQHTGQGLL